MIDYTRQAVSNQLKAMNCQLYEIGIYDPAKGMINKEYSKEEILNNINYLKFLNSTGNNIYIRPAESDNTPLILVDDVDKTHIDKLQEIGINLALIIETSKENFQIWVKLAEPVEPEIKAQVAKNLCRFAHGDPASAEKRHYGRLAGFTNRKEKHKVGGKFPFVLCRKSTGEVTEKSRELIERAQRDIITIQNDNRTIIENIDTEYRTNKKNTEDLFVKYFDEWKNKQNGKLDLSAGDFGVACRLIQEGHDFENIKSAMLHHSPEIETRKGKNVDKYIQRTVVSASAKKNIKCGCGYKPR